MTDTVTSYDQVPYAYYSFPDSHPRRLQAVARLLGLETAAPAQCRVLELGCAVGGNVVPMAYSLPKAQFIGIDLVESQIESARKFATACSLTNLDLRAANIMEVTPEWGQFDYIIAHGVFSWVPHEVAEKVLQLCGELLAPNGLAYISLNTYPGAHARRRARRTEETMADFRARPYSAFNFLIKLGDEADPNSPYAGFQEVTGLGMEITVQEYRAGNSKENSATKITGTHKVTDVTCKRGVIGALDLYEWLSQVRDVLAGYGTGRGYSRQRFCAG